jgi:phosphoribosylformylglycinamidine cyclo-ligase
MSPNDAYRKSGVDVDAGNQLIERIGEHAKSTHNENVLQGLGGFASLYSMPKGYKDPVLVSCTDGVGTKLKLALEHDALDSIGQDLVAMCINDLLATGARPLFFLDYYATARLDIEQATRVIAGIAKACKASECALVGGETAEMPGLYAKDDFDLAGFCVGIAERDALIGSGHVQAGDALIGLSSSGAHSNGYSLIRKILSRSENLKDTDGFNAGADIGDHPTLIKTLLKPTLIYTQAMQCVRKQETLAGAIHAIAHITGGGIGENLSRVLPSGAMASISHAPEAWPPIFHWIMQAGDVAEHEMLRVFNCGIGMILCVAEASAKQLMDAINHGQQETHAFHIGNLDINQNSNAPEVAVH